MLFSFLAKCRQNVKPISMFSDYKPVIHGLPQGTVSRPLISLLCVNDFSSITNTKEKVFQFACDTSIVCCPNKSSLHRKNKESRKR